MSIKRYKLARYKEDTSKLIVVDTYFVYSNQYLYSKRVVRCCYKDSDTTFAPNWYLDFECNLEFIKNNKEIYHVNTSS